MTFALKDYVSFGSLAVSAVAMATSYMANQQAQNLDEAVFAAEMRHYLLKEAHDKISDTKGDPSTSMDECVYLAALAKSERLIVDGANEKLVHELLVEYMRTGNFSYSCQFSISETLGINSSAFGSTVADVKDDFEEAKSDTASTSSMPGKYHAVIASYPAKKTQCAFAKEDVPEFAELLASVDNDKFEILNVSIVRTRKSDSYAVTVDAGDNLSLARDLVAEIQSQSAKSADGRTGHDSFVQVNSDWYYDKACSETQKIGSS